MKTRGLTMLMAAWVLVAAGACSSGKRASGAVGGSGAGASGSSSSSSAEGGNPGTDGGGPGPADAGAPSSDGPVAAPDGSRSGDAAPADGTATRFDAGRDGAGGKGGSSSGATGTGGAVRRVDAGPPGPCRVDITADPGLLDLVAGDNRTLNTLKVTGKIVWGTATPVMPNWQWIVTGPDNTILEPTVEPNAEIDSASIRFPLLSPGDYDIRVSVTPTCTNPATKAKAIKAPTQGYFIRVLPPPGAGNPAGQTCTNGSARWCPSEDSIPLETIGYLAEMAEGAMTLRLPKGTPVAIDPASAPDLKGSLSVAIPSTIHIAPKMEPLSRYSSWTIDGVSSKAPLVTVLDSSLMYDVLVVPVPTGNDTELPPFRTRISEVSNLPSDLFTVLPGVIVRGTVRLPGGPLTGARVFLRADPADQVTLPLPSTWGTTDATGAYSLSVGNDSYSYFSAIVIPPAGTTLPQVTIPNCIHLGSTPDGSAMTVNFTWNALPSTDLTIKVMMPDGQTPAASVLVRLQSQDQSQDKAIPSPGILSIDGMDFPNDSSPESVPSGSLRLEATTDSSGEIRFGAMPKAGYHLVVLPADGLSDAAITTADIDLTSATNDERRIFQLSRKVRLAGTISPKAISSNGRMVAFDTGTDIPGNTISSTIDGEGRYTLTADPERTYRFLVEPEPGKNLPLRIPLYGVAATTKDATLADRKLPTGLKVSGTVEFAESGVSKGVPGSIVQVYCRQSGMFGCMDPKNPTATLPQPVVEIATRTDGTFSFYLPDPGSGH